MFYSRPRAHDLPNIDEHRSNKCIEKLLQTLFCLKKSFSSLLGMSRMYEKKIGESLEKTSIYFQSFESD